MVSVMHFSGISSVLSSQPCMTTEVWHLIKPIAAQKLLTYGKVPHKFSTHEKKKKYSLAWWSGELSPNHFFATTTGCHAHLQTSSTSTQVPFCKFSGSLLVSLNLTRHFFSWSLQMPHLCWHRYPQYMPMLLSRLIHPVTAQLQGPTLRPNHNFVRQYLHYLNMTIYLVPPQQLFQYVPSGRLSRS